MRRVIGMDIRRTFAEVSACCNDLRAGDGLRAAVEPALAQGGNKTSWGFTGLAWLLDEWVRERLDLKRQIEELLLTYSVAPMVGRVRRS